MALPSDKCPKITLMKSLPGTCNGLVPYSTRQQVITPVSVDLDLWRHLASLKIMSCLIHYVSHCDSPYVNQNEIHA